jgi:formate--tetrahydrofolate ligase
VIRHVENMQAFGLPVVVALNHFTGDTEAEVAAVREALAPLGVQMVLCRHWAEGGAGAADLAQAVLAALHGPNSFKPIYEPSLKLADKIRTVAERIYRADSVAFEPAALKKLAGFEAAGFGHLPVCMAKTQYSFSADPKKLGAPTRFTLPVRDVRLSAGAGFVVALCGDILTMPGLPRIPAANSIGLDDRGVVVGLF